jgi:dolichol-phosphate mannosyltransferase
MTAQDRTIVIVPTYNEADNVGELIARIQALGLPLDLLFIDDGSPDGTGELLDRLASRIPELRVLHRTGKQGVGAAHKAGLRWAYQHGYRTAITMDADHSHSPSDIPRLLKAAPDFDVVVGSRFLRPESLTGWALDRKIMTHLGHFLTTAFLGLSPDCTNAFRLYHLDRIPERLFEMVESPSYSFFYESLHRLNINRFRIGEIAIDLPARTYGHSKMRVGDVLHSVKFLMQIGWRTYMQPSSLMCVEPFSGIDTGKKVQHEWDSYWTSAGYRGKGLYDAIAVFYRAFLIRPTVNHFLGSNFPQGAKVLHAGCGSGLVDVDMAKQLNITAFDISPRALTEYANCHVGLRTTLVQGDIFDIPCVDGTFEGIFNLGVMEHFTEAEIVAILREFQRVLKDGGRIVLFWPPSYGLATRFLKFASWVVSNVLKSDVELYPREITHVESRAQVERFFDAAGLVVVGFHFGARDFFTYQVIVAQKKAIPMVRAAAHSSIGETDLERAAI